MLAGRDSLRSEWFVVRPALILDLENCFRLGKIIEMIEETRKPIEIVCPSCGRKTTVFCRETFSGWREGIIYDLCGPDIEVSDLDDSDIGWEYFCYACDAELEEEEVEKLAASFIPLTVQLRIEGGIDLFEDFWKKDQSQTVKGKES